jgi:mRNA interferase RelE/StbE
MPYTARFSRTFLKKEERLPSDIKPRVIETLREILIKPDNGILLVGPLRGLWRVRVGKYRIIYEINEKEKMVVFHDVDLRKRVYE